MSIQYTHVLNASCTDFPIAPFGAVRLPSNCFTLYARYLTADYPIYTFTLCDEGGYVLATFIACMASAKAPIFLVYQNM